MTRGSAADRCVVWLADLSLLRPTHVALLDEAETRRRAAYLRDPDRARFTLGAALLRLAAAEALGVPPGRVSIDRSCPDCGRPHGKPRLAGTGWYASVSHSATMVSVAITGLGEIGIDVEAVGTGEVSESLRRTCLHAQEPIRRFEDFYVYWCRKESVVKATGDGLRVPLPQVRVSAADQPAHLLSYAGRDLSAAIADVDVGPGYRCAVTVLTRGDLAVDVRGAAALLDG